MKKIRFVMIGSFLAGKTTTIGRLAAMYQSQGLKVESSPMTRPRTSRYPYTSQSRVRSW